MTSSKNPFALLYVVMTLTYIIIISAILFAFTRSAASPARILLNDCPMFLKKGFTGADAGVQDLSSGPWVDLSGKPWGIKNSGLADPLPFLRPEDQTPEDFTYALKFTPGEEQLAYIRDEVRTPALYIPAIAENWEIFLNGRSIARELYPDGKGGITKQKNRRLLAVPFDPSLLSAGENTLVFHILTSPWYNDAGLYFGDDHYIDDHERIQGEHNQIIFYIFSGIYFFIAFYDFLMYLGSRKEKHLLFFSMEMLILSVYMFLNTPFRFFFFDDSRISLKMELIAIALAGIPIVFFTNFLCGKKTGGKTKIFLMAYGVIIACMIFAGPQFLLDLLTLAELFLLCSVFFCYIALLRAVRGISLERREAGGRGMGERARAFLAAVFDSPQGNTFLGFNIVLFSVAAAVLRSLITREDSSIALLGIFAFSTSISFAFAIDFSKTKRRAESHNVILEETVRERTAALKEQTARAVAANEAKSKFLATMSHEIRTPMNAILGLSEITRRVKGLPEPVYANLEKIRGSGSSLLGIINDILDLSKIESGKLAIAPGDYDLPSLINDVAQINMVRIGSRNIEFILEAAPDLPLRLRGDELRIKQILNNVLSNAFKYTEKGFVRMSVSPGPGANDNETALVFVIADSGQGMKEEDVKKLFDEYSRFNPEANRATEGTGLGMNITQKLMAMMKGTITVESEYGRGSVFTLSIPQGKIGGGLIGEELARNLAGFRFAAQRRHDAAALPRAFMPYGRVLVVDDLETNLYVASGLMSPYGLAIETAGGGREALEKILAGNAYDIVFMDHMMPGMDGIEATAKIRAAGYAGTIVALTANAISGQEEHFLRNGFDGFISKPIDTRQLDAALRRWVKDKRGKKAGADTGGEEPGAPSPAEGMSAPAPEGRGLPPVPGLDTERGIALTGGTLEGYRKVLAVFRKDAEGRLPLLREAPGPEALANFTTQAHALKSASASIGAAEFSAAAARLEAAGKAGDREAIREALPGFVENLEALIAGIRAALDGAAAETGGGEAARPEADSGIVPLLNELAEAVGAQKMERIDRLLPELEGRPLDPEAREKLEQISGHILTADFDEALRVIGELMHENGPHQPRAARLL
ncbi:MAG: response regulator [Treponema sp.]|jgi:signal transduction histidine kinase/HPt (histidine-containing phosphotransfer) domain-containing protein/ActR/RegA family two-component response regulator|nr:response regulator [Treponema sp.]